MKVLSIQQPWAHAILCDGKDIENRTWQTKHRGPILIHAGKKFDSDARYIVTGKEVARTIRSGQLGLNDHDAPRGGIVGIAILTDIVTESDSKWFFGPFGWVLEHARGLPFACWKGQLGVFEAPLAGFLRWEGVKAIRAYEEQFGAEIAVAERPQE